MPTFWLKMEPTHKKTISGQNICIWREKLCESVFSFCHAVPTKCTLDLQVGPQNHENHFWLIIVDTLELKSFCCCHFSSLPSSSELCQLAATTCVNVSLSISISIYNMRHVLCSRTKAAAYPNGLPSWWKVCDICEHPNCSTGFIWSKIISMAVEWSLSVWCFVAGSLVCV